MSAKLTPAGALDRYALGIPLAGLCAHAVRFLGLPVPDKLSFVPDDAFYYMQLGSEFARSRTWSFDRGRTTTTGFHPLFAYLSALVERVVRDRTDDALDVRLDTHALLGVGATAVSFVLLVGLTRRIFPRGALAATLIVGCAGGVFLIPLQAMEWPWAVLAGALCARAASAERAVWIVPALVFGCFCRTDFVVSGLCLALALFSVDVHLKSAWARQRLLATVGGTALGAALVTAHNLAVGGHLVQSSARMKAHWGAVAGYSIGYGLEPVSYAFSPAFLLTHVFDLGPATLFPLVLAVLFSGWLARARIRQFGAVQRTLFRFSVLAAAAYSLCYAALGTAAMCWYSANFLPALFLLVAALAEAMADAMRRSVVCLGAVLALVNVWDARRPIWNAHGVLAATKALRADGSIQLAASWNAGTLGFLGGEKVINIDGLVNDDVYPYVLRGRLHCYLVHENIPFIVDRADWVTPMRARYLGFADGRLLGAMARYDLGPRGPPAWRVDLAALARDPVCSEDLRSARSRAARPYAVR
jgi:hypothetical protein